MEPNPGKEDVVPGVVARGGVTVSFLDAALMNCAKKGDSALPASMRMATTPRGFPCASA